MTSSSDVTSPLDNYLYVLNDDDYAVKAGSSVVDLLL